jgi:hypothetical protein
MEIYRQNNNSFSAVVCCSEPIPNGKFSGFNPYKDRKLIDSILNKITVFKAWCENSRTKRSLRPSTKLFLPKTGASKKFNYNGKINNFIEFRRLLILNKQ